MKKKIIFIGLWLMSLTLTGCSIVPPLSDRYGSIAPLAAYFRHTATLTSPLLNKELARAEQAFKDHRGAAERIKLAMLLGLLAPQEKRDEAQAIRLLDGYINNNVTNESLTDYAYTLRHFIARQQAMGERENTLKERYTSLETDYKGTKERYLAESEAFKEHHQNLEAKLREEISRNEALQLKLNTLKAIEESIRRRTK